MYNKIVSWVVKVYYLIRFYQCKHEFKEIEKKKTDIFVFGEGFRIADNYQHISGEVLVKDVTITTSQCRCGIFKYDLVCE